MEVGLGATVTARITRAIVGISRLGGRGVVVPGGFVVTAAHCIGWTADSRMALGDYFHEEIVAADGRSLTVQVLAVEPVSDLAVLGRVDDQEFAEAADAFQDFCAATAPVRLAIDEFDLFVPVAAYVFTHDKGVIPARAMQWTPGSATLSIETDEPIEGGTSGSPVVNSDGRLLGIISTAGGVAGDRQDSGHIPRVHLAAPLWLVRHMVPGALRRQLDVALPPGRLPPLRVAQRRQAALIAPQRSHAVKQSGGAG